MPSSKSNQKPIPSFTFSQKTVSHLVARRFYKANVVDGLLGQDPDKRRHHLCRAEGVEQKTPCWIDTHWNRGMSYSEIG